MPENYVQPVTDRQQCYTCHKTVTGKKKLSKCSKCHAITYCGKECQVLDFDRHKWNCIPVMVTAIPGKSRGLVAARDIKMGEFIFLDKPEIKMPLNDLDTSSLMKQVENLSSEAKLHFYKLEECKCKHSKINKEASIFCKNGTGDGLGMMFLYLNCTLINHSCAPNAYAELVEDKKMEVRAIKDISKGEEVTVFYKCLPGRTYVAMGWKVKERKKVIKEYMQFDCKCCVCSGNVPGQEEITKQLLELDGKWFRIKNNEKPDYSDLVNTIDKIVDLSIMLYVGTIGDKADPLRMMAQLSYNIRDKEHLEKAKRKLKKLAEDTKLNTVMNIYEEISKLELA